MNIISCTSCGVVLDKDKLQFPYNIYNEDGVDENLSGWNGHQWVAMVLCPVCNKPVLESE